MTQEKFYNQVLSLEDSMELDDVQNLTESRIDDNIDKVDILRQTLEALRDLE